jgi:hypothetical protein
LWRVVEREEPAPHCARSLALRINNSLNTPVWQPYHWGWREEGGLPSTAPERGEESRRERSREKGREGEPTNPPTLSCLPACLPVCLSACLPVCPQAAHLTSPSVEPQGYIVSIQTRTLLPQMGLGMFNQQGCQIPDKCYGAISVCARVELCYLDSSTVP